MRYEEALDNLKKAAKAASLNAAFQNYSSNTLHNLESVFSRSLLDEISEHGYPKGLIIPWTTDDLQIYGLDELMDHQVGYRLDAKSGQPSAFWKQDNYVIGDSGANPFSIGSTGVIFYSIHGLGTWDYTKVADDVAMFFDAVANWILFFKVERSGQIFDSNFEVSAEVFEGIREKVLSALSDDCRDGFVKSLGI